MVHALNSQFHPISFPSYLPFFADTHSSIFLKLPTWAQLSIFPLNGTYPLLIRGEDA